MKTLKLPFLPVRKAYHLCGQELLIKFGRQKALATIEKLLATENDQVVLINQIDEKANDIDNQDQLEARAMLVRIISTYYEEKTITLKCFVDQIVSVVTLDFKQALYQGTFEQTSAINNNDLASQKTWDDLQGAWKQHLKNNRLSDETYYQLPQSFQSSDAFFAWVGKFFNQDQHFYLVKALINSPTLNQAMQLLCAHVNALNQQQGVDPDLIEREIEDQVKSNIDKQNKEFVLREKLRVIRHQLEEQNQDADPIQAFIERAQKYQLCSEQILSLIKREVAKLKIQSVNNPDVNISRNYLDLLTKLPWKLIKKHEIDLKAVSQQLDLDHYGLKDVKERIIEYLAQKVQQNKKIVRNERAYEIDPNLVISDDLFLQKSDQGFQSQSLCLVGAPGVGKTSIAKSIAKALKRPFIKIALGGLSDEAELRGHRRTYIGAMAGKIISAIKRAGVSNPVILLDEIDKVQSSFKGNPSHALLEILDPEQNKNFQDHYLEVEYDLSQVMFIATANQINTIEPALLDRLEVIELNSYTILEKIAISKIHLIPRVLKQNALNAKEMQIDDTTLHYILKHYVREAGMRQMHQQLDKIARKIVLAQLEKQLKPNQVHRIDQDLVKQYLGIIKFSDEQLEQNQLVGCVNGLAYTGYGGSVLPIEVVLYPSQNPKLVLTGSLKDIMRESAELAIAYLKANRRRFQIDFDFDKSTIHVHVPAGAIPKDGPSAGITFTSALLSALLKKAVLQTVAMTGEITLRGKVLPIGGLKEKALAAMQYGIKKIFIPEQNQGDLTTFEQSVLDQIEFVKVKHYQEIFDALFA